MRVLYNYDKATLQGFLEEMQRHANTILNCEISANTSDGSVTNGQFGKYLKVGREAAGFKVVNTKIPAIPFDITANDADILSQWITRRPDLNGKYNFSILLTGFLVKGIDTMPAQALAGFISGSLSTVSTIAQLRQYDLIPDISNYEVDNIDDTKTIDEYFDRFKFYLTSSVDATGVSTGTVIYPQVPKYGGGDYIYHPVWAGSKIIGLKTSDDTVIVSEANVNAFPRQLYSGINTDSTSIYTVDNATKALTSVISVTDESKEMLAALMGNADVTQAIQALNDRVTALEQAIPIVGSTGNYIAI